MIYKIITGLLLLSLSAIIFYITLRYIIKREMEKTLPSQLDSMRRLLGNNRVRVIFEINEKGEAKLIDFQSIHSPSYVG